MRETIKAIPISEFMKKADDPSAKNAQLAEAKLKILAIRGSESIVASNMMFDDLMDRIQAHHSSLDVATYDLSKMRLAPCVGCYGGGGRKCILPCDRNDIESDIYDPKDEMLKLYDSMQNCDMMLLTTDLRFGQLPSYTSKFFERLNPFRVLEASGRLLLKKKVAVLGTVSSTSQGLGALVATLNMIGFTIPPHGLVDWIVDWDATYEQTQASYKKDVALHQQMERVASSLINTAMKFVG